MKQDILNLDNQNVGSIELNDAIFGLEVRADILHRVVNWQLASLSNRRAAVTPVRVLARVLSLEKVVSCLVRLFATTHMN